MRGGCPLVMPTWLSWSCCGGRGWGRWPARRRLCTSPLHACLFSEDRRRPQWGSFKLINTAQFCNSASLFMDTCHGSWSQSGNQFPLLAKGLKGLYGTIQYSAARYSTVLWYRRTGIHQYCTIGCSTMNDVVRHSCCMMKSLNQIHHNAYL